MAAIRFFFALALLIAPFSVFAQTTNDGIPTIDAETASATAKEKLRQQSALLEQILADAKDLRLPENRALIYAKVGNALWQTDEKRARGLFQNSINDLIVAQSEAESEKGNNKQYLAALIYGQSPRWDILNTIAARDAEFALDALGKTRPAKVAQAVSNLNNNNNQSQSREYATSEVQAEQRLIAQLAEQNPQRAVKLLRESLKKDVTYETINLLKKIFQKDSDTANQLADEVGQKLLDTKLNEENPSGGFIQYFLGEFGQEKPADAASLKVSDQLLRALVEKYSKFLLRPNNNYFYIDDSSFKIIEKYFPSDAAQIRQRQAKSQNQNQNAQSENYSKLMQSDAAPDELVSRAEKFPRYMRNEIYRRAAEKTSQNGNIAEAQKIITANFSEEESENYLSQINHNLANQAIGQGKFNDANQFANQISDENLRINTLVYLANAIYGKDPKENQKWAASVLTEARALLPETPEKISEINALVSIAAAYATFEPAQAFRQIDSLTAPLNEFSEAAAVVAKYNGNGNIRQGEYQINRSNNPLGIQSLTNALQTLKDKDFDRTLQFVKGFNRLDVRISLEMQLIDSNFSNISGIGNRNLPISRSGGFSIDR